MPGRNRREVAEEFAGIIYRYRVSSKEYSKL